MSKFGVGSVFMDASLSFEKGGFVCPLEHGRPNEHWCVVAEEEYDVQLAVVSHRKVVDGEGALLFPESVITEGGKRVWVCAGYCVVRCKREISPDLSFKGVVADRVMSSSLERVINRLSFRIAGRSVSYPPTNWEAVRYLRGELWNVYDRPNGMNLTVQEAINNLPQSTYTYEEQADIAKWLSEWADNLVVHML